MSAYVIAGYASIFGVKDLAGDIVEKGAFAQSLLRLPARSIRMLYQHDSKKPIGEWLQVVEDEIGLWVEGVLDDHAPEAKLARALIQSAQMDGLSIGFRALDFTSIRGGGRNLKSIDLREISLVGFPMQQRARLRVRHHQAAQELAA
ncbi:MAG: HK97 family phage prohead protease [Hyphomonadaceae bacterium]|nr:MAG: HK97 family phage prohead protease [Hyphomonadaceae bacterium]KAF0183874.1 MAG: HK97 family phage prohead protease [Hyphomonadaceae bacterium]